VTEAFIFEELHPKKPEEKKGGQFDFVQQTSRATQSHKLLLLFVSLLGSLQEAPAPWKAWCCQEGWSLERRRGIIVFVCVFFNFSLLFFLFSFMGERTSKKTQNTTYRKNSVQIKSITLLIFEQTRAPCVSPSGQCSYATGRDPPCSCLRGQRWSAPS